MKFNPVDFLSAEEIETHQLAALKETIQYLFEKSPYYSKVFSTNRFKPENIRSLKYLQNFSTTTKEDFSNNNFDFLCVSKSAVADYTTTSGTTGHPVTVALTENDLERLAYNEQQSFITANCNAESIFQLMLTLDRQFMAGMAYYLGIRRLKASAVRVGAVSPQMQWENILRFNPDTIVAVPSFILKLIDYAEQIGIDYNNSSVKRAICIGEPIRLPNLTDNTLSSRIKQHWNIELYGTYASTEMQTAFTECKHSAGGHLRPELLVVEILDDEGNQLDAGEYGEVTITTLGVEGMPLFRYRTGDICCFFEEPCKCGRNSIRLSPVVGRKNQMLKYKGTTLFPPSIYDALSKVKQIKDYIVEVKKNDLGTDEILIHLSLTGSPDEIEPLVKNALQTKLRVIPDIRFTSSAEIQQMRPAESRKPVYILFRQ